MVKVKVKVKGAPARSRNFQPANVTASMAATPVANGDGDNGA